MIRWNNDYNQIAHPKVLAALKDTVGTAYAGYGADEWCEKAADTIRSITECPEAAVYFFPGATQANFVVIDASLRSIESVICADGAHIFAHEAGSVEKTTHKLLSLPCVDGKITAEQIREEAAKYYENGCAEYLTKPKMVYISFATEMGTIYSKAELTAISEVCKKYGMYLFMDGARLSYGLGAAENDITPQDLARLCDVFYFGGTKCGAMLGEAVVVSNPALTDGFRTYMKRSGAVMAKSWLMGVMFETLLADGTYFEIARQADAYAMEIKQAFVAKGVKLYVDNPTNQQFVVLNDAQLQQIGKEHISEYLCPLGEEHVVRFCTSWATTREEVDALLKSIAELPETPKAVSKKRRLFFLRKG